MKVARMSNRPEPNLWLSWAGATASRGMLPDARVYACKALHLAPGDADVLAHLGSIQFRMERYDEAAASLEEAQSITPQSWTIAYLLAATKFALADLANSEVQFTKAIADCPDDATRRLLFAPMAYPILAAGDYVRGLTLRDQHRPGSPTAAPPAAHPRRGRPRWNERVDAICEKVWAHPKLGAMSRTWENPLLAWRALALINIRHAAAFEPDLPYPVARHIMSEISRCFEAADPGGYDDLLNHVELARRTGDGMTLNNAAGQIAHESEANVRLQNALHKRLRQSFGKHADLYRLIAVDPNTRAAIDRLIVEHERRSIRALAVAAVSLDFVASQA